MLHGKTGSGSIVRPSIPAFRVGDPGPNPGRSTKKTFLMASMPSYMRLFRATMYLFQVAVKFAVGLERFATYFADELSVWYPVKRFFWDRRSFWEDRADFRLITKRIIFHKSHFKRKRCFVFNLNLCGCMLAITKKKKEG